MTERLTLLVCSSFLPEILEAVNSLEYDNVNVRGFPSSCSQVKSCEYSFENTIKQLLTESSRVIVIGGSCVLKNAFLDGFLNAVDVIKLDQCFEVIAPVSIINHFTSRRYYLLSNGALRNYKNQIKRWGFTPENAVKFFGESMSMMALFDTGIDEGITEKLEAVADYTGLEYEIFPIGLSYCRLFMDSIIRPWNDEVKELQLKKELAAAYARTADNELTFHQLNSLIELVEEHEIVQKIFELLNTLFMPENIQYIPYENGHEKKPVCFKITQSSGVSTDDHYEESERSFNIIVTVRKERIGEFKLSGIALPQHIQKYMEISRVIGNFAGLAIANSRKFMTIKDDEKKIRQYSEQLKQLIATKDKFFSIIAHDLKSPFSGFIGLSGILAQGDAGLTEEELSQFGRDMHDSANNLYRLLNNLLEWASAQQGEIDFNPESTSLLNIITENVDLLSEKAALKEINITIDIKKEQNVFADVAMLKTIIRNLVSNAIKFTETGGEIVISSSDDNFSSVIAVKDNGVGMTEEYSRKLFKIDQKIGTLDTEGEAGTGLGLLLCQEFIQKHGGKIWVESCKNDGTTFFFTLPYEQNFEENSKLDLPG